MTPFFFGPSEGPLFGVLHEPSPDRAGATGVVLCSPIGFEYVRSHRAMRHLAERLARKGYPALRFDYFGCGDSAGDDDEASLSRWREDISTAVLELRDRTGVGKVCLVGRALGASLALQNAAASGEIDALTLWDPIVDGKAYLRRLNAIQGEFLSAYHGRVSVRLADRLVGSDATDETPAEYLGMRFSRAGLDELESLNLREIREPRCASIQIVDSPEEPALLDLVRHLESTGAHIHHTHIPDPRAEELHELLMQVVPNPILNEVGSWLDEVSR